ncbi:hypothetical protein Ccrd_005438 [Cynara cardunculus var. scolymus]|uniref:Uncharacterized protein n=1 Tax=Cynara cardunculus var. scolymus TaxID=59895 RepID=A0A103XKX8_CYNCS|nr:hypothetical protein Ccrd_005438 [Cynara cardunculus var. scolymus]
MEKLPYCVQRLREDSTSHPKRSRVLENSLITLMMTMEMKIMNLRKNVPSNSLSLLDFMNLLAPMCSQIRIQHKSQTPTSSRSTNIYSSQSTFAIVDFSFRRKGLFFFRERNEIWWCFSFSIMEEVISTLLVMVSLKKGQDSYQEK